MKIIDKITALALEDRPFYSFEYFPPRTEAGLENLYARLERMARLEPAFVDVTWGAGGSTSEKTLKIATTAERYFGLDIMMHLTCTNMPVAKIDDALERAKDGGITNILALRGDAPKGQDKWEQCEDGFNYAANLTRYIRQRYGPYFGIGVGGYPEGHLEARSKADDVVHLKAKIDEGADFVITQLFYDLDEYFDFIDRCRAAGIDCPIVPGLMPIHNYERFRRFTEFCQTKIPPEVDERLEQIKDDDAAVKVYGIELCIEMCRKLRERGVNGFHFYTLNLESSVTTILDELGWAASAASRRALPWRVSSLDSRRNEDVRPIFWSNRPKSYLARTMDWDDFPNGRWGDARSPSFGDLNDYYLIRRGLGLASERRRALNLEQWGTPTIPEEVYEVFARFCRGEIKQLPWCDTPVRGETSHITEELVKMNRQGLLTINSQPQVNGASSTAPDVGWGGAGGFVYQKAYVEFFLAPQQLERLLECLEDFPTLTYYAVNVACEGHSNCPKDHINAVTWGVFPGREIVQPTVVDSTSFLIWKDEAFQLWLDEWASLYEADSAPHRVIREIRDSYYLMNVVENNFIDGDIFRLFERLYSIPTVGRI